MIRYGSALAICIGLSVTAFAVRFHAHVVPGSRPAFDVSYAGTDYYAPATQFTGCALWTWLRAGCYHNSAAARDVPRQVTSDLTFIDRQHQGGFQRLWVSLDQLMYWNNSTGYRGYDRRALANLDDVLRRFAAHGQKVDLVLLTWAPHSGQRYQFHPEALDGDHSAMRAGYLHAVHDFMAHLAANPTDAAVVTVVDLQNEAYYMLDQYFAQGKSSLGTYTRCWTGSAVDTDCVEQTITHPWLTEIYNGAHHVAPAFRYTVSDTGWLLTATASRQHYWEGMYPVDVYDIHLYDDAPWNSASRWASGRALPKPWFGGEAGCAPGNTRCTYNGDTPCARPSACALSVDGWWLATMKADGARAVLVEDRSTAWTYPGDPSAPALTRTGRLIQRYDTEDH